MTIRHIGVVTASRSDFGLLEPLMSALQADPECRLSVLATGMHFSARHGMTIDEIRDAGFAECLCEIPAAAIDDSAESMAKAMSGGVAGFAGALATDAPDIMVVMGDRLDVLPAVVAALPFGTIIAHISGGELSEGVVDDRIRHAITKMSHLHFTAHPAFARRVVQMGEQPDRVFVTGEPGLDALRDFPFRSRADVLADLGIDDGRSITAFTFHPDSADANQVQATIEKILGVAANIDTGIVFTYPNADPGSDRIIAAIGSFRASRPDCRAFPSLGRRRYFDLLNQADCMVGNSSSGLVEAPSFGLPVVNIGDRQLGRIAPANVINVPATTSGLSVAWQRALSVDFRKSLAGMENPYGDGQAVPRIVAGLKQAALGASASIKSFLDLPENSVPYP